MDFKLSDFYQPLYHQQIFHESSAKYKCYMGGVGSGKTTALVWEVLLNALEYPGNYGLVGRYTYPELRDTTMFEFFQICPDMLIEDYKKTEHKLLLKNGSIIIFRHLEDPDKLKSLNLGFWGIDEMTEVPRDVFRMLQSRLRRKNVGRRTGFGSTNPEGQDWVYNLFHKEQKDNPKYLIVQAPTTANPHLPDDYVDDLIEAYDEIWQKRYIEGDPTAFAGQIITSWDKNVHVIQPFDIPEHWQRTVVLDHGTHSPTAVNWFAMSPEGFHVVYKEHYAAGQLIEWHTEQIYKINGSDDIYNWLADPAIWNRTLQDPKRGLHSVADRYAEFGLDFMPADNDVKLGIQTLLSAFRVNEKLINPFTQKLGSPRIFIFNTCEHTIEELPQYRWKDLKIRGRDRNVLEEPEKSNDHTVDNVRYYLMSNPRPVEKQAENWGIKSVSDRLWDRLEQANEMQAFISPVASYAENYHEIMRETAIIAAKIANRS